MTFEQSRLRSDILGTQVITRSTGRRLGMVSQLWVDIDRGEVVALGLRENILSNVLSNSEQVMLLSSIRQIGDVVLVDDDTVLDADVNVTPYSNLVNSEVITESGDVLGRVRGFKFDVVTGKLETLVIASFGLPQIPDPVLSTYELPVEEIASTGPDRIIVFEDSEKKMVQLTVGILERLGLGTPPWERNLDDGYRMPVSASNQLPSGVQTPVPPAARRAPAADERWREEAAPRRDRAPQQAEAQDSWQDDYPIEDVDVTSDVWEEPEEVYEAQPLNIPQKKKVMEYEEEPDY
ncbi:PRC-barrel domain-containing protein [Romeria aff. gracilis LEGE 07310]|uniref:PRC-barrel domain-containing protein n=1 Tax=Vasconcelosia minhoensis LEGE 07310 TaxID=915328 RepID=A0A8J7A865_9CYAN|nr:PRC-barrel domain-containing protein [Romeria gracilis]MBE9077860.1 PRC-barrel domain-containing protein [Romeria aff. gracilis LEGE 07310]